MQIYVQFVWQLEIGSSHVHSHKAYMGVMIFFWEIVRFFFGKPMYLILRRLTTAHIFRQPLRSVGRTWPTMAGTLSNVPQLYKWHHWIWIYIYIWVLPHAGILSVLYMLYMGVLIHVRFYAWTFHGPHQTFCIFPRPILNHSFFHLLSRQRSIQIAGSAA